VFVKAIVLVINDIKGTSLLRNLYINRALRSIMFYSTGPWCYKDEIKIPDNSESANISFGIKENLQTDGIRQTFFALFSPTVPLAGFEP
jgi:hypothetical protein